MKWNPCQALYQYHTQTVFKCVGNTKKSVKIYMLQHHFKS